MIKEEYLYKMYEGIIAKEELTTKKLKEYGWTSKDITWLVQNEFLTRTKRGHYSIKNIEPLFEYGKKQLEKKEEDKAEKCFLKCFELSPNHYKTCIRLFLRSIENRDYEKAFLYFKGMDETKSKYYQKDCNFFLYLLSNITDIPREYKKRVNSIELKSFYLEITDNRYKNIALQNKLRALSWDQKFSIAMKEQQKIIEQQEKWQVQDIIIKLLLYQAVVEQSKRKKWMIHLIQDQKYQELIEYLENMSKLSQADTYTLLLAKDIIELIKGNKVEENPSFETKSIFAAIKEKNYHLALELSSKCLKKKNINQEDNTMFLLLKNIENRKKENAKAKEEKEFAKNDSEAKKYYANFIGSLMQHDLEKASNELEKYLKQNRKEKYLSFLMNLIKLNLYDQDLSFTEPILILNAIVREKFTFSPSTYITLFFDALLEEDTKKAKIYLDILKSLSVIRPIVFIEELKKSLEKMETREKKKTLQEVSKRPERKEESEINIEKEKAFIESKLEEQMEEEKKKSDSKRIEEIRSLLASGMSLENACSSINLNEEQTSIITLIYIKECYIKELYALGDKYLKKIERANNKSETVKSLLLEVRKNKFFYKNKLDKNLKLLKNF